MAQIEDLKQEQSRIEQEIKIFMKENERASNGKYRVSWSNVSSMRLDAKLLKQEHPKLYSAYAKESVSRKFQIKAA